MRRSNSGRWQGIWRTDGVHAALAAAVVVAICAASGALTWLEYRVYDAATRVASPAPLAEIAIVGLDDASLAAVPALHTRGGVRDAYARLIEHLTDAGAKTIVLTPSFAEAQSEAGLAYARRIRDAIGRAGDTSPLATELNRIAGEAEKALDSDGRLAASITRAGNVFIASYYALSGGTSTPLPPYAHRSAVPDPGAFATAATTAQHPIAAIGSAAAGVGHVATLQDEDGAVRRIPLLLRYDHVGVPALALLASAHSLHLGQNELQALESHRGVRLGGLRVATDSAATLRPRFHANAADGAPPFSVVPLADVLGGRVQRQAFKDKIVLVGETSEALVAPVLLPGGGVAYPVELLAQTVSAIRQGLGIRQPDWAPVASWGALLAVLLCIAAVLPRLSPAAGWLGGAALVVVLIAAEWGLLRHAGHWIPWMAGALALLVGLVALTVLRLLNPKAAEDLVAAAETDRMMGLALQGQGQLDMAFERLRKVPPSDALMDNLYHLAMDFERKRNYAKAKSAYKLILQHNREFKDAYARYKRVRAHLLKEGDTPSSTPASVPPAAVPHLPGDPSGSVPTLGRYRIDKEIGKGAMGVVYLGKDPKIGRVVAIKTLALGNEFEGEALIDARARFFREAETAGRLQHPYIVTIFDAGEEHDLAYIAMEFLKGADLAPACRAEQLLPVATVVSIASRVAEALDYAHAHNVVHRDIKPANIMFDHATDTVKVTDFGIARITDSSRTRTGMVLGTPSFMSPEQLAGKKVDGRSDLYSLGVTLFQLLTGSLPLRGDSMTELMHRIANVEAPDIRQLRPDIPTALAEVVARALQKRPEARYQTGRQFAADLRQAGVASGPLPSPDSEALVYDARRDATGHEMAHHQRTVMATPAERDASSSSPVSGAR